MDNKRVAYITNIAPHYRNRLWLELANMEDVEFHFFYDSKDAKSSIRQIDTNTNNWKSYNDRLHSIKNVRYKKVLFWQKGVFLEILKNNFDIYIFLGDMNILSTWIAVLLLRFKKNNVIFWGHGIYGNEKGIKKWLRKIFLSLGNRNFVYNHFAKKHMTSINFDDNTIDVVYNSLDYVKHKKLREKSLDQDLIHRRNYFSNINLPVLVFIGRLTPQKKLHLLIEAVKKLRIKGNPVNLLIIGSGSEEMKLKKKSKGIKRYIYFYGACYNEEELGLLIANSDLCVSPGEIGLTAIHSLSYGTPVCTHNKFTEQMPEFEAIEHGKTGIFYDPNKQSLDEAINEWLTNELKRNTIRKNCYKIIDEKYNPYNQIRIFKKAFKELKP